MKCSCNHKDGHMKNGYNKMVKSMAGSRSAGMKKMPMKASKKSK